jgi:hypothetical protein
LVKQQEGITPVTRNVSDAWRGSVDVGDCLIYVALDGPHGAPHLMLSNSLGSDLTMWDPQLAAFSQHFRVIRYDSRGHGKSGAPPGPYTMERLGRDAVGVLDDGSQTGKRPFAQPRLCNLRCAISGRSLRRSHEQTCGNADTRLDQVRELLLAGVNGQAADRRGRYFATGSEMTCRVVRKLA